MVEDGERGRTGDGDGGGNGPGRRWVVLGGLLLAVAVPTVALWVGALTGGRAGLAAAATVVPLAAFLVVGVHVGRKVGASPDEPDVVGDRLAESLDRDREELEEFFE